jgi:prolyl-tRNA synthetase
MGGSASEEFMVASEVGEETLLLCAACGYRANQEKAQYKISITKSSDPVSALEKIHTPETKTIDDLVKFFGATANRFLKTLVYEADGKAVIAVCTGDRDINEVKLKNVLGCAELNLAADRVVEDVTKAPVGFAGPVGQTARIIFDSACALVTNAITGANEKDYHFKGVNPGRDFEIKESADITLAVNGDQCPECSHAMHTTKGIEVGHIFKLGYKYTKGMNFTVLDKNGKAVHPIMGCYGIGVTRTLAAVVEQHHDDKGLTWPKSIAPFDIHLVGIGKTDDELGKIESVYNKLTALGYDVLYDDRKASPGVKFADADLIGLPLRITIGKSFFEKAEIEALDRTAGDVIRLSESELEGYLKKFFNK